MALYNVTLLPSKVNQVLDDIFIANLSETEAPPPSPNYNWTATKPILILSAIICSAVTGMILGTILFVSVIFSRQKLTGGDSLILNHCFIDLVTCLFIMPLTLSMQYVYDEQWQHSLALCHAWNFLRGFITKASGISLTVLSIHQIGCITSHLIPNCRISAAFPRLQARGRRSMFSFWLVLLVAVVWLVSFAAETTFFEMEPLVIYDRCVLTAETRDAIYTFLFVEEVMTFWIPTTVSAFMLVYMVLFFTFFRAQFHAIIASDTISPHAVIYSPHGDLNENASLIDTTSDAGTDDWADSHSNVYFENQFALPEPAMPGRNSTLTIVPPATTGQAPADKEVSWDSFIVWTALCLMHFFLVVPSHIMQLVIKSKEEEQMYEEYTVWQAITLILATVKACCADFVVLLLTPRYRRNVVSLFHRIRQ